MGYTPESSPFPSPSILPRKVGEERKERGVEEKGELRRSRGRGGMEEEGEWRRKGGVEEGESGRRGVEKGEGRMRGE